MTLLSSERRYHGRIISLDVDTVRFPDNSTGQLEMIRHPGAAAVVPFLDDPSSPDPRVLLIRQFRHAADGYIWEIPAGRLDPGEAPEQCAARELKEETGMVAGRLEHLTTIYTTPGFTDERIHLFLARGLEEGQHHREVDEFLELVPTRWSQVLDLIRNRDIMDGKTLCALLYAGAFRVGQG
ncbi:MAG TPA: NUDIX hydrolase [Gemmatimonadales bacterium]|nr:NUDIX hydrolase [Gemmatimonadales bacterium]